MQIEIEHRLRFDYDAYIHESLLELRVEPLETDGQHLRSFELTVGPPARVARYVDWNRNPVHHFGIGDYHERIEVASHAVVERSSPREWGDAGNAPPAVATGSLFDFVSFGGPVVASDGLRDLDASLDIDRRAPVAAQVREISHRLYTDFEYRPGVTDYRSTLDAILEAGGGVCQDFAHLMLGVLRLRGIPARYLSGYLHVDRDSPEPSQSHAWIEAWAGADSWLAFDPTHDGAPDEHYIAVARGRSYDDVPPNRGLFRGAAVENLHSAVHTRLLDPGDRTVFGADATSIDVPVFRELPAQPAVTTPTVRLGGDPAQQQQQQQQQTRRRHC